MQNTAELFFFKHGIHWVQILSTFILRNISYRTETCFCQVQVAQQSQTLGRFVTNFDQSYTGHEAFRCLFVNLQLHYCWTPHTSKFLPAVAPQHLSHVVRWSHL